ncbi:helix-turn-helix domain-containing protein [Candidimonas nitroreducens]|uniref:HTH araC/xylS-type domain-containing protein n=1 Tax=Candidimonas nitroreducens TaxID=683354 RepID=A0A225M4Z6_9BURK|nr:helix-turn-helix domain-containing protein [Candidimonas nitroreducens]OWT56196.1 hypothetical protein CEY11_19420 [Candidimonas nitroreducens]
MESESQSQRCAEDWRRWKAQGSRQQRVDYWNDVICQAVLDVDMTMQEPPVGGGLFRGSISSLNQVGARFVNFRSSGHEVTRTPRQVGRTDGGYLMVSLQYRGQSRLTQNRSDVVLNSGDVGIVDSGLPFSLFFPQEVDRRIVMLPKSLLAARTRSLANWRGPVRIASDFVLTPLIAHTLRMLTERAQPLTDSHAHLLLESVADYVASCLSQQPGAQGAAAIARARYEAVLRHVAQHIADVELDAGGAAAAAGMSVRTLHRLFERYADCSFEQHVIRERLHLARRGLAAGRHASVSAAAFAAGFNDLSHFTRRFRASFGISPSSLLSGGREDEG